MKLIPTLRIFALLTLCFTFAGNAMTQEIETLSINADFEMSSAGDMLLKGVRGTWNDEAIYFPNIVYHDGIYHLFFSGRSEPREAAPSTRIGYATSEDGLNWEEYPDNPIFVGDGTGFDGGAVMRSWVMIDEDGTWRMYYRGQSVDGESEGIGLATAPEPTGPWQTLEDPVLTPGSRQPEEAWDSGFLYMDAVHEVDDGYVMYYSAGGPDGTSVGRASSEDGLVWTKYNDPATDGVYAESDPVLVPDLRWEGSFVWMSHVRPTEDGWEMFYDGNSGIGYARSEDGIHWIKAADPIISRMGQFMGYSTALVDEDGNYNIYFIIESTRLVMAEGTIELQEPDD